MPCSCTWEKFAFQAFCQKALSVRNLALLSTDAQDGFLQLILITDNDLILVADTDKITNNFTFLYFKWKFMQPVVSAHMKV